MSISHGFELIREVEIAEINTLAQLYRHNKSGAQLLSLQNDDENKVFNISFRTPPTDSTGLPHIMEHAVLGGSRKYQVKEPFVELVKGSLNTFVNAMTFPDQTSYPVASQNLQDFRNLIEVYLDAVFYPLITPHHLAQEGWHLELEDIDAPLTYKGIVFNEMKGAYSSPDAMLNRHCQETLFPDNAYAHSAGGDPAAITDLTYLDFKRFHETYYHPSNALILFYGDDPPQDRLRILNEYLDDFEAVEIDASVSLQTSFDQPRRFTFPLAVDSDQENEKAGMVQLNWLLPEGDDPELVMAHTVLSYALVSTPASPLRKALIDSGLGEDVTGGGLETQMRQMSFGVGLKGINVNDAEKVEALILETLALLAEEGLESAMVEAAVNTIEFSLRENNTGRFPRGLAHAFRVMTTWLYGGDPMAPLAFEQPLAAVKENLALRPDYLQSMIRTYFIENTHRTTVILEPDPTLQKRQEEAEKQKLARLREAMTEADLREVMAYADELRARQNASDSPEALAAIPVLTLDDLERQNKLIPIERTESRGCEVLYHDLFTNGIVYLDLGFNLKSLPQNLLPYAGIFGTILLEMGTEKEDFVKLSQRIGAKTGGISTTSFSSSRINRPDGCAYLFLRGKATMPQADDLLSIIGDVLLSVKLDDPDRLRQMVLEAKASQEAGLIPGGHGVVNTRLKARFNEAGWVAEQTSGLEQLFFLRRLADRIDSDWQAVLADLIAVRDRLVNRSGMICNVTLDSSNWSLIQPRLDSFLEKLPAVPVQPGQWKPTLGRDDEGLTIPVKVNYVAKGSNLYKLGYQLHGSISVITNLVRSTWLWEKVRVQGGAYGGFIVFDKHSGVLSFISYRDPNLTETLAHYDGTAAFLQELELSSQELAKNIIGSIGTIDGYQLPDAKGYTSMLRHLIGESDEDRQRFREQVLATSINDFRALAKTLAVANQEGLVAVLGSQEAIAKANESNINWLRVTKVM